jgi:hypothetical protein
MGMDFNIYAARNHEVFNHEDWWNSDQVEEKFYSRKAWHFVHNCPFISKDYTESIAIPIDKEQLEEMIKVACENRNYWGDYKDVPKLCELRDEYDDIIESGKKLYVEVSY